MVEDLVNTDKTLFYNKTLVIKLGLTTHSSESKNLEMCSEETHISYGHHLLYLFHYSEIIVPIGSSCKPANICYLRNIILIGDFYWSSMASINTKTV